MVFKTIQKPDGNIAGFDSRSIIKIQNVSFPDINGFEVLSLLRLNLFQGFSAIRLGVFFYSTPKNYMRGSDCDITYTSVEFALNLNKNSVGIWFSFSRCLRQWGKTNTVMLLFGFGLMLSETSANSSNSVWPKIV